MNFITKNKLKLLFKQLKGLQLRLIERDSQIHDLFGEAAYQVLEMNIHPETEEVLNTLELITAIGAARHNELMELRAIKRQIQEIFDDLVFECREAENNDENNIN